VAATGFTVDSATTITTTAPVHATGAVDVTVTTPAGASATSANDRFTYVAPPPAASSLLYYPLASPIRLLDTRRDQSACDAPGARLAGGATRTEPTRTACAGIPAEAEATVGNATVVNPASGGAGFVTLYPSGAGQPPTSNLNYVPEQVVPNAFTVGIGGDGAFAIFSSSPIDFIVDVTGYYSAEPSDANGAGLSYISLPSPVRLLDTRAGQPACDQAAGLLGGNTSRTDPARNGCTGVPAAAGAVVGNATVVNPASGGTGFVTLYPGGAARPNASNLNYLPGQVAADAFIVRLGGDRAFAIYAYTPVHFVVDLVGYIAP
jgi:hypothetical protein